MRQFKSLLIDLALIAIATVLALILRDNLVFSVARFAQIQTYLAFSLLSALVILPASGITRTMWRFGGFAEYRRLTVVCLAIVLTSVTACFAFTRLDSVMRAMPVLQFILMTTLLSGVRLAGRAHRFRHAQAPEVVAKPSGETVLVIGLNAIAELFLQAVAEHGDERIRVAGLIGRNERQTGQFFRSYKVLGVPEELESVIRELDVHGVEVERIVVTVGFDQLSEAARAALLDIEKGTRIKVDFFAERLGFAERPAPLPAGERARGQPASVQQGSDEAAKLSAALSRPYWRAKRAVDAVLATVLFLAVAPLMLVIGLLAALSLGLPVLFWQQRPGRFGQPFKVYKFRSLLGAHGQDGQRLPDEMRETLFGRFLRATRLDELPQLLNILAGHMSFIGPRPLLGVDQLEAFRERLSVRPGLTGWAQVNGGRHVSAQDKMALDLWYINNASFALDCRIVMLTVRMVVRGEQENPLAVRQAWSDLGR